VKTIYAIKCEPTGESYVGATVNLKLRMQVHCSMLRGGYQDNTRLQRAWNKHGESSFRVYELETVGEDWAMAEHRWMVKSAPLFNQMSAGIGGAPIDPEVLQKRNAAVKASWARRGCGSQPSTSI
jgi:group I intron endonuclease